MLKMDELRDELKDRSPIKVSRATGIHRNIIMRFRNGGNVLASTAEKLSDYIERNRK
jgi:hypothetical protein